MSAFQSGLLRDLTILSVIATVYLSQGIFAWSPINLFFVIVGVLESIMMAAYYSASRDEMTATTMLSYPFSSILIIISSGFLFGEWQYFDPSTLQGLGNILMTLVTLFLVTSFQSGKVKLSAWNSKLILSALMVVIANLVQKWAVAVIGLKPASYMIYEYLGLVLGGFIFVYGRHLTLKLKKADYLWGLLQGCLFSVSIIWYAELLRTYPLSVSSIIRRIAIVLGTTLAGLYIFREHKNMNRQKYLQIFLGFIVLLVTLLLNH